MQHHAAVSECPSRSIFYLITDKAILYNQQVSRKLVFVKNVTKLVFEFTAALIVTDFHYPIFHPERVSEIVIYRVIFDFDRPAIKIFSVEQLKPSCRLAFFLSIDH